MKRLVRWADGRPLAVLLAVTVVGVGIWKGTWAAGGSDSYGYVSQAALLTKGQLMQPSPWIMQVPWPDAQHSFTTFGYTAHRELPALVPIYSPGLPLLMAIAQIVGGPCAVFLVVPITGGVVVLLTWKLGVRLGGAMVGLLAAWLVATSAAFLFQLMQPMSDVPVSAAWIVAIAALLVRTTPFAVIAGLSAALAILIRPNLAPILGILVAWAIVDAWRAPRDRRRAALMRAVLVAGIGAISGVVIAWLNLHLRGSVTASGYGGLSDLYTWANVPANIGLYFRWLTEAETMLPLVGLLALFLPFQRIWPTADRSIVAVGAAMTAFLLLQYLTYFTFDSWTYLRFFLPIWPFIMIGVVSLLRALVPSRFRWLYVVLAIALVFHGREEYRNAKRQFVFDSQRSESKYPKAGDLVRRMTEPGSVIFANLHSGSLRYYAGRMTMHFDRMDREWLDRAVAFLASHGAHPYALLEDFEVEMFRTRFKDVSEVGKLALPPVFAYYGGATIYLYDLTSTPETARSTILIKERFDDFRCLPPQPPPTISFDRAPDGGGR